MLILCRCVIYLIYLFNIMFILMLDEFDTLKTVTERALKAYAGQLKHLVGMFLVFNFYSQQTNRDITF